jgi:hypothetical protein
MVEAFAGFMIGITRMLRRIKEAGATSEDIAKTPEELGLREADLKRLKKWGVHRTEDGRYFVECKDGKHC